MTTTINTIIIIIVAVATSTIPCLVDAVDPTGTHASLTAREREKKSTTRRHNREAT